MTPGSLEKLEKLSLLSEGDYKAFLYDCDGTLADNMPLHKAAYVRAAENYEIHLNDCLIDELAGMPTVVIAKEIVKRYNKKVDPLQLAQYKVDIFLSEFLGHTLPLSFVVEHLKTHSGKVKMGVVSGGNRTTVTHTLKLIGVYEYIDVLVCAGETKRGKPYPDPFLLAANQLGVKAKDCIVFEDKQAGVKAAERAGMKWIRIDHI